jgi:elongation factor P
MEPDPPDGTVGGKEETTACGLRLQATNRPFDAETLIPKFAVLGILSWCDEQASNELTGVMPMASIRYSEVRKGMVIVGEDKQLYAVLDRDLRTPGNLPSKLTLKMKNLKTGFVNDNRVHPDDKVEQAYLDRREMQYLYKDGDEYVFMDTETFDQTSLSKELVGELMVFMKEGNNCSVVFHDGKALSVELPATVELEVVECDPSLKGATATAQYKPATLETGLKVTVPPFIEKGEIIIVDTNEGKYMSRKKG